MTARLTELARLADLLATTPPGPDHDAIAKVTQARADAARHAANSLVDVRHCDCGPCLAARLA